MTKKNKFSISGRFTTLLCLCMLGLHSAPARSADMIEYPVVKLRSLEKVTARTETFEANVGSTVKFGSIYIKVQTCRKSPPIEKPEAAAFLQIWENDLEQKARWVFSGWMFASSPGLSSMDHPIYDVWVLDCLDNKTEAHAPATESERGEGELEKDAAPQEPGIDAETP